MTGTPGHPAMPHNPTEEIALRIRGLREAAGLSADDTARALDLEPGQYARYEAGRADVPMGTLSRLAALFRTDAAALLTGGEPHARLFSVTRRGAGPIVERRRAYHYESLGAGFARPRLEPFLVTVEPKPGADIHLNAHPGQEFNRVIKGRLKIVIAGHAVVLKAGDSILFDSSRPHGMAALGGRPAQFLAVITA